MLETGTMEKETPAKKAAAPSVSQINAEFVTQVIAVHRNYMKSDAMCYNNVFYYVFTLTETATRFEYIFLINLTTVLRP